MRSKSRTLASAFKAIPSSRPLKRSGARDRCSCSQHASEYVSIRQHTSAHSRRCIRLPAASSGEPPAQLRHCSAPAPSTRAASASHSDLCLPWRRLQLRSTPDVSTRQHTSAYVCKRQSAFVGTRLLALKARHVSFTTSALTSAYVSIRQHTSAYACLRSTPDTCP